MHQVHEKSASLKSKELQLKHFQLQAQALAQSERQFKKEKDQLEYEVASRDQDILLLEVSDILLLMQSLDF